MYILHILYACNCVCLFVRCVIITLMGEREVRISKCDCIFYWREREGSDFAAHVQRRVHSHWMFDSFILRNIFVSWAPTSGCTVHLLVYFKWDCMYFSRMECIWLGQYLFLPCGEKTDVTNMFEFWMFGLCTIAIGWFKWKCISWCARERESVLCGCTIKMIFYPQNISLHYLRNHFLDVCVLDGAQSPRKIFIQSKKI
jgi:hypothetical protein